MDTIKYYNVLQHDETDCAAACLSTICMFYGLDISVTKLRDLFGTDIKGTTVYSISSAANKINFKTTSVRIKIKDLNNKLNLPIIVNGTNETGISHFIVLYKIKKTYVLVADPANKVKKMTIEEFDNFYSGVCILIKPNSEFVVSKSKSTGLFTKFLKLLTTHKEIIYISNSIKSYSYAARFRLVMHEI